MIDIIIATHGKLASAALELCEMLTGEKDHVQTIGFLPGDSIETLTERFQTALASVEDKTLILTDIQGGSPCNVAMVMKSIYPDVVVITGFNIPLLLEIFDLREDDGTLESLIQEVVPIGREAMQQMLP